MERVGKWPQLTNRRRDYDTRGDSWFELLGDAPKPVSQFSFRHELQHCRKVMETKLRKFYWN